jgi:predicted DCC family thiol-disulfide oxidoreductase YuxK
MANRLKNILALHESCALAQSILFELAFVAPAFLFRQASIEQQTPTSLPRSQTTTRAILRRHIVLPPTETLFYDGHCGLCHSAVKFVLKHDRTGTAFYFAPLQGRTFREKILEDRRAGLPDSIVVLTARGTLLTRSDAFLHICRRLGGGWRMLAAILSIVPRGLRDAVYNFIARIRYRIFGRRDELCPIVPTELRARFLE